MKKNRFAVMFPVEKGDEAKKITKSMCYFDTPFVRYALSSSYRVHYPRSALNASYNNVRQNTGIV